MSQDPQIQEILLRTDLVDLVGHSVRLTRSGRSFKGLCPFHPEKTPSFHVYPIDGMRPGFFRCYGCQKSGDALTFLMEKEGLTFLEALDQLAAKAGMEVARQKGPSRERRQNRLEVMERCQGHFRSNLKHPRRGAKAREYLSKRQIGEKLVDRFGLGYALEEWDALFQLFQKDPDGLQVVTSQGLVRKSDQGGRTYDFFRDRLMFPIHGHSGQLVAFAGRDLSETSNAKYMNSAETDLFKKSRILYGLYQARETIREKKRAILVEGYFDVIRMHEYGFEETIAPMGTAVTEEQLGSIDRMADELILLFDGDTAGESAARRSLEQTWNLDLEVRVVHLPHGQDPDDYLLANDAAKLEELLSIAVPSFRYLLDRVIGQNGLDSPSAIRKGVEEVFESLAKITSSLHADLRLKEMSERFRVPFDSLKRDWDQRKREIRQKLGPGTVNGKPGPIPAPEKERRSPIEEARKGLLALLLWPEEELRAAMGNTFASDPNGRQLLQEALATLEATSQGDPLSPLIGVYLTQGPTGARARWEESVGTENLKWEIEAMLREDSIPEEPLRTLRDYTHTLRRADLEKRIADCKEAFVAAERSQNWEKVGDYAAKLDALAKERDSILSEPMQEAR